MTEPEGPCPSLPPPALVGGVGEGLRDRESDGRLYSLTC